METNLSKYIIALQEFQVEVKDHSGRTLMDHLLGTYRLLEQWGNPHLICLSGLFHSIYGTKYYQANTISLESRGEIQSLIGAQAEQLVYYFCLCDRKLWLSENPNQIKYTLLNYTNTSTYTVSPIIFSQLAEISMANWLEQIFFLGQFMNEEQLMEKYKSWKKAIPFCSKNAINAFEDYFRVLNNH